MISTATSLRGVTWLVPIFSELKPNVEDLHEQRLVSVLKQIHDELDAAVFDAYGWPVTLTDEEILERLVALNAERTAEEARGLIRWLRPDFQNRSQQTQQSIDIEAAVFSVKRFLSFVFQRGWCCGCGLVCCRCVG